MKFPDAWRAFAKACLRSWGDFQRRFIEYNKQQRIPIHYVRYEDLLQHPSDTLKSLFSYILGLESIEGTVMEARIDDIIDEGPHVSYHYPLKRDMNIYKSAPLFEDPELKEVLETELYDVMEYFDYIPKLRSQRLFAKDSTQVTDLHYKELTHFD